MFSDSFGLSRVLLASNVERFGIGSGYSDAGILEAVMSNKGYKSERLQYQLRFYVSAKRFKTPEARDAAIKSARRLFLQTGRSIAGVRIVARWRNPDNKNPRHADWKTTEDPDQSLHGFWKTLGQGRGALR